MECSERRENRYMDEPVQSKKRQSIKKYWKSNWWKHILQVVICIFYLIPFYVIVVMSLKSISDSSSRLSLPKKIYWGNYQSVFQSGMGRALINSLIITVAVVFIEVIVGCMAAYPLARNDSKLNRKIMNIFLAVMMIPGLSVLVGVYSLLSKIGGVNTYWGMILASVGFGLPTSIYLYSNFINSIPVSLDEAAIIDGAGAGQTFFYVLLPQLKPVTVTVIIMQSVGIWNEYMYSLYILQKADMFTITLKISSYFSSAKQDYGGAAAASVLGMIPIVVLYLALQKYFVKGAVDSAVKG